MKYLIILISFLFIACDDSGLGNPPNYFVEGENAFMAGDYQLAVEKFIEEIDRNNNETALEARAGLAWSYLRLGDFTNAEIALTDLHSFDATSVDYYAVSTLIHYTENDHAEVEDNAMVVLGINDNYYTDPASYTVDTSYELFMDEKMNHKDIALTLALSLFKEKRFDDCLVIVHGFLDFQWNPTHPGDLEFSLLDKLELISTQLD